MSGWRGWLVTIGGALLALTACVSLVWLVTPWDLATRVAIGTSAGVVVGAVIALWGAAAIDHARAHPGGEPAAGPHEGAFSEESASLPGGVSDASPAQRAFQAQDVRQADGAIVVNAGGDVHFGSSSIVFRQPAPVERGAVTAIVTAYQEPPPPGGWPMASPTRHEGHLVDGRLTIQPTHPYLDLVNSGAELTPLGADGDSWRRNAQPARLDIKVVNNTHETVVIHQVRLDVDKSIRRLHSIPYVTAGNVTLLPWPKVEGPVGFGPGWPHSWAPSLHSDVTLNFHLEHPGRKGALTSEYSWEKYPDFGRQNDEHPLMQALSEAGAHPVDDELSALRIYQSRFGPEGQERSADPRDTPRLHSRVWNAGPFNGGQAIMAGVVSYVETDAYDAERVYSHRFRCPVNLEVHYPIEPRVGAALDPSAVYVAPVLREEGVDYPVYVPVSHSLTPGEADRLLVALPAKSASTHTFRVTLLCGIGSVDGGTVQLETFGTGDLTVLH